MKMQEVQFETEQQQQQQQQQQQKNLKKIVIKKCCVDCCVGAALCHLFLFEMILSGQHLSEDAAAVAKVLP